MKNREILFLIISAFIIVIAWIGFNLYHSIKTSTIPQNLTIQILPISPNFDNKTIEEFKKREKVQPDFNMSIQPSIIASQGGITE